MTRATCALAALILVASFLVGCFKKDDEWEIKPEETYVEPAPAEDGEEPGEDTQGVVSTPMEFAETVPGDPTYGKVPYAEDDPFVRIETEKGVMIAELYKGQAPNTVENFVKLVKMDYYDGLPFHRIVRDFMIQGGDNGADGPGWSIDLEVSDVKHAGGTLSMARTADPNSAGAQFFICHKYSPSCQGLDGGYAAFGRLVYGMEVVEAIIEAADDLPGSEKYPSKDEAVKILSTTLMTWDEVQQVLAGEEATPGDTVDEPSEEAVDEPAEE